MTDPNDAYPSDKKKTRLVGDQKGREANKKGQTPKGAEKGREANKKSQNPIDSTRRW